MLSSYACNYEKSKGRLHVELESRNRTPFQRDRDRIIHTTSFRRLEYKTQVFVNLESDHFRNRLTHSIEVSQVTRVIAKKLGLDEDLAEGMSLAHDIGHPPFGHAGEDALKEVMKKYGSFDHNVQSLKILTQIEGDYADFKGLNLTYEMLEGVLKHNGPIKKPAKFIKEYNKKQNLDLVKYSCLESQVSALSDDIAYNNHDIDDGFRAGLLVKKDIVKVPFIDEAFYKVEKKYPNLDQKRKLHEVRRIIYSDMVDDVITHTKENIEDNKIKTCEDVRNAKQFIANFSPKFFEEIKELKRILLDKIYTHPEIKIMSRKASTIISDIFNFYMENPECSEMTKYLNNKQQRAETLCDYIAGMTDRFAFRHHQKLFDLHRFNPSFT